MNINSYLIPDDISVRTQITLTKKIKELIEKKSVAMGISVSEYLRRAALVVATIDDQGKTDLMMLAKKVVGSVDLRKHPEWKDKKSVVKWQRDLRSEWDS